MRPPDVFVRELSPDEGNRLKRLSKTAKQETKRQRALICWASATRMSVPVIARLVDSDESHVRKVIHAFNERGFQSLDPDWRASPSSAHGRRARADRGRGWCPPRLDGSPFDALVAAAALGVSEGARGDPGLAVAFGADPARGRAVLSTHAYAEGLARPRLHGQGGARDRALQAPTEGVGGDLLRPDGPGVPQTYAGSGLGAAQRPSASAPTTAAGGHPLRVRRV